MSVKNSANQPIVKTCTVCNLEKPLDDFNNYKRGKYGKKPNCRECQKIDRRAYTALQKKTQSKPTMSQKQTMKIRTLKDVDSMVKSRDILLLQDDDIPGYINILKGAINQLEYITKLNENDSITVKAISSKDLSDDIDNIEFEQKIMVLLEDAIYNCTDKKASRMHMNSTNTGPNTRLITYACDTVIFTNDNITEIRNEIVRLSSGDTDIIRID